jgi:endoglucanase
MKGHSIAILVLPALLCVFLDTAYGELYYRGINECGAEFGTIIPGTYGYDYVYPNKSSIDYFVNYGTKFQRNYSLLSLGMNTIRLPFLWERVQLHLGAELDATEMARMDNIVNYAAGKGVYPRLGSEILLEIVVERLLRLYWRFNGNIVVADHDRLLQCYH